jgi:hypothetical protein
MFSSRAGVLECRHPALESKPFPDDADAKDQAAPKATAEAGLHDPERGGAVLMGGEEDAASHAVLFIGWYTGSRRSVITGLKWTMLNLETGIMQRKERGASQPKSEARRSGWEPYPFHILRRWSGLILEIQPTSSTSVEANSTDRSARGNALGSMRDFLITLFPTSSDTPAPPTCSSKASRSGKRQRARHERGCAGATLRTPQPGLAKGRGECAIVLPTLTEPRNQYVSGLFHDMKLLCLI